MLVRDYPNPLRERGIAIFRFANVSVNRSLTRRVVIIHRDFAPLIFPNLDQQLQS
jgi:hypothetical protein